ncbi:DUF4350 domain-containing protein [Halobellus rubicundus]|uniref:DUF4350 domain-containing protein n=1 Tax=Halobellus rubicundus TaxID=2996466 RepID=A0ABD5MCU9_9EURY
MADATTRHARYAVVGLAILVILSVGVGFATSTAPFSAYNAAWDGSTNLEEIAADSDTELTVATTVESAYEGSESHLAIVLSPDRSYTAAERSRIREYVIDGGTLLVADDFGGHATGLLRGVGARSRFDGRLLRDERRYYRTPNITLATATNNSTLLSPGETLTLNHGTALSPNGTTVLATSSEFSYLDTNRNYALDEDETLESRPVVTRESIGEGTVLVVSDPSLFINAMSERDGNRRFIRAVLQRHDQVAVDASHTDRVPPLFAWLLWMRSTPPAQVVFGVIALLGIGLATTHRHLIESRLGGDEPTIAIDHEAIVAYISAEHPEWDDADVNRMIAGVIPDQHKKDDDD